MEGYAVDLLVGFYTIRTCESRWSGFGISGCSIGGAVLEFLNGSIFGVYSLVVGSLAIVTLIHKCTIRDLNFCFLVAKLGEKPSFDAYNVVDVFFLGVWYQTL